MTAGVGGGDAFELDALKRREPAAVESWFQTFADPLFTFVVRRVGGDRDVATDVVQEVFVTALRQVGDYDPARGAMFPWLTYRARNVLRTVARQRGRFLTAVDLDGEPDAEVAASVARLASAPDFEEHASRAETAELIHETLWSLSSAHRSVLQRHYCDGASIREIATEDSSTVGAVKSMLHRARAEFRSAFTRLVEPAPVAKEGVR